MKERKGSSLGSKGEAARDCAGLDLRCVEFKRLVSKGRILLEIPYLQFGVCGQYLRTFGQYEYIHLSSISRLRVSASKNGFKPAIGKML